MKSGFFENVYQIVKRVPKGKVATYGQIAKLLGRPQASKFVGFALNKNPYQNIVPCHRIVNKDGFLAHSFAFGGIDVQKALLVGEGVEVNDNYQVNLKKYQWKVNN